MSHPLWRVFLPPPLLSGWQLSLPVLQIVWGGVQSPSFSFAGCTLPGRGGGWSENQIAAFDRSVGKVSVYIGVAPEALLPLTDGNVRV